MPSWAYPLAVTSQWSAMLPAVVCLLLLAMRKEVDWDGRLLVVVLIVSFAADYYGRKLGAQGINNWWLSYLYAPIQFGLYLVVVTHHRAVRAWALGALMTLAIISVGEALRRVPHFTKPELGVQVAGGVLVWAFLWGQPQHRYRVPILLLCVGSLPFFLAMGILQPAASGPWLWCWAAYSVTRVAASGAMAWVLVHPVEVRDGATVVESPVLDSIGPWVRAISRRRHRPFVATKR